MGVRLNGGAPGAHLIASEGDIITVTDSVSSPAPLSRIWRFTSVPSNQASPPTYVTPTAASTTFTVPGALGGNGTYTVELECNYSDGSVSRTRAIVAVKHPNFASTICLPSPGFDPLDLLPDGQAAVDAGWAGSAATLVGDIFESAALRVLLDSNNFASEAFQQVISLDHNARQTVPSGSGDLIFEHALTGSVPGVSKTYVIPAGSGYSNVVIPDSFTPDAASVAYDAGTATTKDYVMVFIQVTASIARVVAWFSNAQGVGAPTITATVDQAAPDKLRISSTSKLTLDNLTGLDLPWTVGTPRTLSSILSGKGTTDIIAQMSGAAAFGDIFSFRRQAGHSLRDLDTNLASIGSTLVTNNAASILGTLAPFVFLDSLHGFAGTSTVTSWTCRKSGLIYVGTPPILTASNVLFNGQPTATFTGGQYLHSPVALDFSDTNAITIYLLMVKAATTTTGQVYAMLGDAYGDTPQFLVAAHSIGPSTTYESYFNHTGGLATASTTTAGVLMTTAHVVKVVYDYSATTTIRTRGYIDDMTTPVITATASCAAANFANTRKLGIGNIAGLTLGGKFDLASLVILKRVASTNDDTVVKGEWHSEYGTAA